MYFLVTVACLLLTARINGLQSYFGNRAGYNPCNTRPGIFFYPDPSDVHKFYQCDASGHAYSQSCASPLVWDDMATTCNWPSAVAPPSVDTTTTTFSPPVTDPGSVTDTPAFSLCKPVNPCGPHGQCFESSRVVIRPQQRFSCICDDGWFGRLCDKPVDSLSSQQSTDSDQIRNRYSGMNIYSPRIPTTRYLGKNIYSVPMPTTKYVNYGLNDRSKVMGYRFQKRILDPNFNKGMEVSSTTEQYNPTNLRVATPVKAKF